MTHSKSQQRVNRTQRATAVSYRWIRPSPQMSWHFLECVVCWRIIKYGNEWNTQTSDPLTTAFGNLFSVSPSLSRLRRNQLKHVLQPQIDEPLIWSFSMHKRNCNHLHMTYDDISQLFYSMLQLFFFHDGCSSYFHVTQFYLYIQQKIHLNSKFLAHRVVEKLKSQFNISECCIL